jgi:hypothetical protein
VAQEAIDETRQFVRRCRDGLRACLKSIKPQVV